MNFWVDGEAVDSVELKCLVISRGLKIDREVYQKCGKDFRKTKELLTELYVKYNLEPAGCCGLNVCVERDIWRQATGAPCC